MSAEAGARGAGVLFLGDFWDRRGALPVSPLNAALQELRGWGHPTLMLVGNHDQVRRGRARSPALSAQGFLRVLGLTGRAWAGLANRTWG